MNKWYAFVALVVAIIVLSILALAGVRIPPPGLAVSNPTPALQPRLGDFSAGSANRAIAATAPTPVIGPVNYVLTAEKPIIWLNCGNGQLYKLDFGGVINNRPHLWIGLNDREVSIPPEPIAGGWIYRGAFGDVMVYHTPPRAELANIASCPDP